MRATLIAIAAALAFWTAAPRTAHACGQAGQGYGAAIAIALAGLSVDAGFTLWDAGSAALSHQPSAAYGVVELLISAPQFVLGAGTFNSGVHWYTIWMGALSAHAIWTIGSALADARNTPA